jgi:hypothetical protein
LSESRVGRYGLEPYYILDLGKNPRLAKHKLAEMREEGFLSQNT